jgi:hypothetical protein
VVQDHGICHWRLDVPVLFITLFFSLQHHVHRFLRSVCELPGAMRITAHAHAHTHRTRTEKTKYYLERIGISSG